MDKSPTAPLRHVVHILPPQHTMLLGMMWSILELRDRRRQAVQQELAVKPEVIKLERFQQRLLVVLCLVGSRILSWLLKYLSPKAYRTLRETETAVQQSYRDARAARVASLEPTTDELEAERAIAQQQELFASLNLRFAGCPEALAYLSAMRAAAMTYGHNLADARSRYEIERLAALREGEAYRWRLTNFATVLSVGLLTWKLVLILGVGLSLPFFVTSLAQEKAQRTLIATIILSLIGALAAFLTTFVIRIINQHRRMKTVEQQTMLRLAEAELSFVSERLRVLRELWPFLVSAYRRLEQQNESTDTSPVPADVKSGFEGQVLSLELERKRLAGQIEGLKIRVPLREKISRAIGGIGQTGEDQALLDALG